MREDVAKWHVKFGLPRFKKAPHVIGGVRNVKGTISK